MLYFAFGRVLRGVCAAVGVVVLISDPVQSQDAPTTPDPAPTTQLVGEYVHSQRELVAGIRLSGDGRFEYGLTVGSLDERAQGRWKVAGSRVDLTSDPRPVAPTITTGRIDLAPGEPFAMRVLAPNGRDMPGVDLRIEFDTGEPLESYLAGGPWPLPPEETRVPRFVTFSMPSYRLQSERLPVHAKAGTVAIFLLTPNDFGVADLTGSHAEVEGDSLTLYRPEGIMRFRRAKR